MYDFILLAIILFLGILFLREKNNKDKKLQQIKESYDKQFQEIRLENKLLKENKPDYSKIINIDEHNRIVQELQFKLNLFEDKYNELEREKEHQKEKNKKLISQRQSRSTRTGKIFERIGPLLPEVQEYFNIERTIPIFDTIDYIHFGENSIDFIDFKYGNSSLSKNQQKVKYLIKNNKITFKVVRVNENGLTVK